MLFRFCSEKVNRTSKISVNLRLQVKTVYCFCLYFNLLSLSYSGSTDPKLQKTKQHNVFDLLYVRWDCKIISILPSSLNPPVNKLLLLIHQIPDN